MAQKVRFCHLLREKVPDELTAGRGHHANNVGAQRVLVFLGEANHVVLNRASVVSHRERLLRAAVEAQGFDRLARLGVVHFREAFARRLELRAEVEVRALLQLALLLQQCQHANSCAIVAAMSMRRDHGPGLFGHDSVRSIIKDLKAAKRLSASYTEVLSEARAPESLLRMAGRLIHNWLVHAFRDCSVYVLHELEKSKNKEYELQLLLKHKNSKSSGGSVSSAVVNELEARLTSVETNLVRTQTQLGEQMATNEHLEKSKIRAERAALEALNQLEDLKAGGGGHPTILESLELENAKLRALVDESKDHAKNQETTLEGFRNENAKLREKVKALNMKCSALEDEVEAQLSAQARLQSQASTEEQNKFKALLNKMSIRAESAENEVTSLLTRMQEIEQNNHDTQEMTSLVKELATRTEVAETEAESLNSLEVKRQKALPPGMTVEQCIAECKRALEAAPNPVPKPAPELQPASQPVYRPEPQPEPQPEPSVEEVAPVQKHANWHKVRKQMSIRLEAFLLKETNGTGFFSGKKDWLKRKFLLHKGTLSYVDDHGERKATWKVTEFKSMKLISRNNMVVIEIEMPKGADRSILRVASTLSGKQAEDEMHKWGTTLREAINEATGVASAPPPPKISDVRKAQEDAAASPTVATATVAPVASVPATSVPAMSVPATSVPPLKSVEDTAPTAVKRGKEKYQLPKSDVYMSQDTNNADREYEAYMSSSLVAPRG